MTGLDQQASASARAGESGPPAREPLWHRPRAVRWALIVALVGALEALTRSGIVSPTTLVPPSEIVLQLVRIVPTAAFAADLGRTASTIVAAFLVGVVGGVPLGVLFWRKPAVGRVMEPFVVTLYAMPTLVFYPILLAVMGLNAGPIIVIAALMSLIPIALTTMVALNSVKPVLHKLAKSTNASPSQYYRKVLVPAVTPLALPGLKLGFIYAIIGTIAMEFILASRGIGFRAGYNYREFEIGEMYAYITVVVALAVLVNSALTRLERRIRRDML